MKSFDMVFQFYFQVVFAVGGLGLQELAVGNDIYSLLHFINTGNRPIDRRQANAGNCNNQHQEKTLMCLKAVSIFLN
ncbi:hypothetical protein KRR40_26910 [Niabella defluvii]|nr:hypothetical protein KRR40_26910 [Niabella sp. I65]